MVLRTFDPNSYDECWYQYSALRANETKLFKCHDVMSGRYVIIHFETTKTERLRLCEVAIYQDTGIVLLLWDSFVCQKVSEASRYDSLTVQLKVVQTVHAQCQLNQLENMNYFWQSKEKKKLMLFQEVLKTCRLNI